MILQSNSNFDTKNNIFETSKMNFQGMYDKVFGFSATAKKHYEKNQPVTIQMALKSCLKLSNFMGTPYIHCIIKELNPQGC